jgi:hypothetical protein
MGPSSSPALRPVRLARTAPIMPPSDNITKRIFLVGCSRSGTTLLQVSVASHPRITSFPETFFFQELPGALGRLPLWMGAASAEARPALEKALEEIGRPDLASQIPTSWRLRPYVNQYLRILDEQALEEDNDLWLEKTPMHVQRLRLILQYVPRVHVLHMVRDGRDVVGSIYHRAHEYPDEFPNQKDPDFGINRWNRSLRESMRYLGESGHTFVVYEQLIRSPERTLRRVCRDLGISYDPRMVQGTDEAATATIPKEKQWIQRAKKPPEQNESKFQRHFSPEEQRSIEEELNLSLYDQISESVAGGKTTE